MVGFSSETCVHPKVEFVSCTEIVYSRSKQVMGTVPNLIFVALVPHCSTTFWIEEGILLRATSHSRKAKPTDTSSYNQLTYNLFLAYLISNDQLKPLGAIEDRFSLLMSCVVLYGGIMH